MRIMSSEMAAMRFGSQSEPVFIQALLDFLKSSIDERGDHLETLYGINQILTTYILVNYEIGQPEMSI